MLQRYLAALGADAADHVVISLLPLGPISEAMKATGAKVLSLGMKPGRISWKGVSLLRRRLRAERPDVVQGWMYHGCLAAWAGVFGRRRRDRPVLVWSIHHSLHELANEKPMTRRLLRLMAALSGRIDAIIYCSSVSQAQHEAIGFSTALTTMIPNAVDTREFHPDREARARLGVLCGIPEERLIIGNAARGHPMKDHGAMVRAVGQLLEQGYDVQAVILGEGHEDGAAVRAARALGVEDRVSILGARTDVAELVPGFDIFLLSSAWGEAFPLAVAEAMASEVPCVVTDVGDCAILVGDTGLAVPSGDADALARAVAKLIEAGSEARADLGRQARARVSELCETGQYVKLHKATFDRALDMRRLGRNGVQALT